MSESSTPVIHYNMEGSSKDVLLSPTTPPVPKVDISQVDISTADIHVLPHVIEHWATKETWPVTFCNYLLDRCTNDSVEYTRYMLNARHIVKDHFLELISSDASIRSYHTPGEPHTSKTEVANMLRPDYVGRYPHFLLVAARRYMLVNDYPDANFVWTEGRPCYYTRQLVVYPWATDYKRLCQSASAYWLATFPWRTMDSPREGDTTAHLTNRSVNLIELATYPPEASLRAVLMENFRDHVYVSFQAETQAYLRRFLVRCDNLQGLTVDDLRNPFDQVFRVKRRNPASDDDSDQITVAAPLYQRILVHLVHSLYSALRPTPFQFA